MRLEHLQTLTDAVVGVLERAFRRGGWRGIATVRKVVPSCHLALQPEVPVTRVPEILPLSTERLQLRLTRATDAAALLSYYMDPDVVRYTPHEPWTRQSVAGHIAARTHRCGLNGEG